MQEVINVLKFRTLVFEKHTSCELGNCPVGSKPKCLDKQGRPSLIRVFPVCYSDKKLVNSSPEN